ncbi:MAG: nucleotidyltransferase family protein [Roseiarcus sp.]
MHAAIAHRRDAIAEICRRFGVKRLEIFGSAARGDDFDLVTSDADFLVEFAGEPMSLERYFGLSDALSSQLGRRVDLVSRRAMINPYLATAIDRDRELIYAA